jgi:hypothetical protein
LAKAMILPFVVIPYILLNPYRRRCLVGVNSLWVQKKDKRARRPGVLPPVRHAIQPFLGRAADMSANIALQGSGCAGLGVPRSPALKNSRYWAASFSPPAVPPQPEEIKGWLAAAHHQVLTAKQVWAIFATGKLASGVFHVKHYVLLLIIPDV